MGNSYNIKIKCSLKLPGIKQYLATIYKSVSLLVILGSNDSKISNELKIVKYTLEMVDDHQ